VSLKIFNPEDAHDLLMDMSFNYVSISGIGLFRMDFNFGFVVRYTNICNGLQVTYVFSKTTNKSVETRP